MPVNLPVYSGEGQYKCFKHNIYNLIIFYNMREKDQ